MRWDSATLAVAEAEAGGRTGLGYTYTDASAAGPIGGKLAEAAEGRDALDVPAIWRAMQRQVRNLGREGLAAAAISAVDAALWDLKAKLLGLPLALLLGRARGEVPIYGSRRPACCSTPPPPGSRTASPTAPGWSGSA